MATKTIKKEIPVKPQRKPRATVAEKAIAENSKLQDKIGMLQIELHEARRKLTDYTEQPRSDFKYLIAKKWGLWTLISAGLLAWLILWGQSCKKNAAKKDAVEMIELKKENERLEVSKDSLQTELDDKIRVLDTLYHMANEATEHRKKVDREGQTIREQSKIKTDEFKKKISTATDSERDAILEQLFRARRT